MSAAAVNLERGPTGSYEIPTLWRDEELIVVFGAHEDRIFYEEIAAVKYRRLCECDCGHLIELDVTHNQRAESDDEENPYIKKALVSFVKEVFRKSAWLKSREDAGQTFCAFPKTTFLAQAYVRLEDRVWKYIRSCFPEVPDAPFTIIRNPRPRPSPQPHIDYTFLPMKWFEEFPSKANDQGVLLNPDECLTFLRRLPLAQVTKLYTVYSFSRETESAWSDAGFKLWQDYITDDLKVKASSLDEDAIDPEDRDLLERKGLEFGGILARFIAECFKGDLDLEDERYDTTEPTPVEESDSEESD